MLVSRAQVGLDSNKKLKFFDYEDSKLKTKFIIEPFVMTDEWLDMFLEYLQENNLDKIEKWETFEDHRGFLTEK